MNRLKRLKNSVKIPKYEEKIQKFKNSKTDILEKFVWVSYAVSMNFIDVLKKAYMLRAKNTKPQYANEIKVQIFKISKNRGNTPKIESAQNK